MNPFSTIFDAKMDAYPFDFLQEICVMEAMGIPVSFTTDCEGFQMVVTEKASDDEDEVKHITHEEMDDAPEGENMTQSLESTSKNDNSIDGVDSTIDVLPSENNNKDKTTKKPEELENLSKKRGKQFGK